MWIEEHGEFVFIVIYLGSVKVVKKCFNIWITSDSIVKIEQSPISVQNLIWNVWWTRRPFGIITIFVVKCIVCLFSRLFLLSRKKIHFQLCCFHCRRMHNLLLSLRKLFVTCSAPFHSNLYWNFTLLLFVVNETVPIIC